MVGRTHGQQALPVTYGYKLAVWVDEIDRHLERAAEAEKRLFVGNLTGAVGTMASFGDDGIEMQARALGLLGLAAPRICWHSARDRIVELAALLAQMAGTMGKIAKEIYNLQRLEIGEVREPFHMGKVGSSTMQHKQNPANAELVIAQSRLVRGALMPLTDALFQDHERDAGCLRIELAAVPEAVINTGAVLRRMRFVVDGMEARPERMAENAEMLGGLLLSERVMLALGEAIGKQSAHEVVYEIAMQAQETGVPFRQALGTDARIAPTSTRPRSSACSTRPATSASPQCSSTAWFRAERRAEAQLTRRPAGLVPPGSAVAGRPQSAASACLPIRWARPKRWVAPIARLTCSPSSRVNSRATCSPCCGVAFRAVTRRGPLAIAGCRVPPAMLLPASACSTAASRAKAATSRRALGSPMSARTRSPAIRSAISSNARVRRRVSSRRISVESGKTPRSSSRSSRGRKVAANCSFPGMASVGGLGAPEPQTTGPVPATVVRCMRRLYRVGVERDAAVQRTAVVPPDQVADPPGVPVGVLRSCGEGDQLVDQGPGLGVRHIDDAGDMGAEIERLLAGLGMGADDRMLDRWDCPVFLIRHHGDLDIPARPVEVVHPDQALERPLARFGQGLASRGQVGEGGIAAGLGRDARVQQRGRRRNALERGIAVPLLVAPVELHDRVVGRHEVAVLVDVAGDVDLRPAVHLYCRHVDQLELANLPAEGDLLVVVDLLLREHQHRMLEPDLPEPGHDFGPERSPQVEAGDLGADRRRQSSDQKIA